MTKNHLLEYTCKKAFPQNSQENTSVSVSFLIKLQVSACNSIIKEILAQTFFCDFWENFKNTFLHRISPVSASAMTTIVFREWWPLGNHLEGSKPWRKKCSKTMGSRAIKKIVTSKRQLQNIMPKRQKKACYKPLKISKIELRYKVF